MEKIHEQHEWCVHFSVYKNYQNKKRNQPQSIAQVFFASEFSSDEHELKITHPA